MGKVRVRKETNRLYMDFRFKEVRFREQTALSDTPANRRKVEKLLDRIEAKIVLDQFEYADFFPKSRNLNKFRKVQASYASAKPLNAVSSSTVAGFVDFAQKWKDEKHVEWRASHQRNIESIISGAMATYFKQKAVNEITKEDVLGFRNHLAQQPGRKQKPLSAKTINSHMGVLRNILDEAADRFGFDSPYRNINPLRLQRSHVQPFSLEEVHKITTAVRADFKHYYTVRFFSGLRTGEIDGLRWEFVDFERKTIAIRETLIAGQVEYTKTDGSQREIPMLGPVYAALQQQYQATKQFRYVFCNSLGKPLDHNNVTKRVWYPLLRHLRLDKRRPYETRHTAATLLLASGENPEFVARFLGHSSTEMLFRVYSRYIPNLTRNDGSAFEKLYQTKTKEK